MQIIVIFICALLTACSSVEAPPETPAIPVLATTPVVKDITLYLDEIGTLVSSVSMEIHSQVSGPVEAVLVSEGQFVQAGTPLFQIDSVPYEIKVQEARARFVMDVAERDAAEKKLERFRDLSEKDLISQNEWDELETQVAKTRAAIHLDESRLHAARLDLEHCTIKSPVDGRVGKLDVHPGFLVTPATPLVTIANMDPLVVEFTVTEKEYLKISLHDLPIEMHPLCSTENCHGGTITFLDNHFDAKTGLLLIRGKVPNPEYALRPGQSVRVSIPISVEKEAKLIPQKAIRYNQQGPYVYVVQKDNTVAVRQIVLGLEQGSDQIVLEGLEPKEYVITDGHLRLFPGIKVEIQS